MKVTKITYPNNFTEYRNEQGKLHREDGPAVIYLDRYQEWRIDGKFHREDGPALIHPNGTELYCINGKEYTYEEWFRLTSIQYKWKKFCEID